MHSEFLYAPTLWVLMLSTLPEPREHMAKWLGGQSTITKEMRDEIRDLNADTSQTVFAGEWMDPPGRVYLSLSGSVNPGEDWDAGENKAVA